MKTKLKNIPSISRMCEELEFGYENNDGKMYVVVGEGNWCKDKDEPYTLKVFLYKQTIGIELGFHLYKDGEEVPTDVARTDYGEFRYLAHQLNVSLGELLYDKDQCYSFFTALKIIKNDVKGWRIQSFKEESNREMEKLLGILK